MIVTSHLLNELNGWIWKMRAGRPGGHDDAVGRLTVLVEVHRRRQDHHPCVAE